MISQISKAMSSGFTSDQIMEFLVRKFPQYEKKIKKAIAGGFSVDQVLKFLGGSRKGVNQEEGLIQTTEHESIRNVDIKRREDVNKRAVQGAGIVAAPFVAKAAMPIANAALQRVLPSSLAPLAQGMINQTPPEPILPNQLGDNFQNPKSQQPPVAGVSSNIAQPQQVPQPEVKTINASDILEKLGSKKKIDELIKSGNDAEGITGFFKKFHPKLAKDIEEKAGMDFENVMSEYISGPKEQKISEIISKEEKVEEQRPVEKKSTVASPQGIGEVLEVRNGQAIIDVDGKKHKVPVEELTSSPIPKKDLADLYEELLRGVEEETGEQVSRAINVVGYDPERNSVSVTFDSGDQYGYDDLDEEEQREATELLGLRKTSGSTHIGTYSEGSKSPAGARISAFIEKLQSKRGGKGNEYAKKYKSIYRSLGAAEQAHKMKYKPSKKKKPNEEE